MNRVVVTGMGVVSPLGNDAESMWRNLVAGRSGIVAATCAHEKTASRIAGIAADVEPDNMDGKELKRQSRYILFAMEAANQAWRQSGVNIDQEDPYRCGTIIGSGIGGIEDVAEGAIRNHEAGPRRVSPMVMPKGLANMAPGVVAIHLGLKGPNKSIVTACASGAQSLAAAWEAIRYGQADVMMAGGAEAAVIPYSLAAFSALRALSTRNDEPERASRPFDLDRDGFVMGEGAGMLVLESETHARKRGAAILGELAGSGETCDAYHVVAPRPDGSGPTQAMKRALQQAEISASLVDYCNAHGTSTKLNDAAEALAFQQVFGESLPPVSSTKSMIGHLLGAAGAVEAIVCLLSIRDNVLHPNINYETPDPECPVNVVSNTAREQKVDVVLSNSLGFGGHNATLVFRRYV